MSEGHRRLAAIMFTDMVGYTSQAQRNETEALVTLDRYYGVLRPFFAKHGGREVKTVGDAFLVEFRSSVDAIIAGAEIQEALRNECQSRGTIPVRIGIHLGEVIERDGDIYGDAVNVASRIEPLAEPGGICVTRQVHDNAFNKLEMRFTSLGLKELKNVAMPVEVFKVTMPWEGSNPAQERVLPQDRLAVLPLVNISPDPNDEFFADGLTEELITQLSQVKGLKVIARTSVMNYKKKEKNVSQIGRELGVGMVMEGSIRKAGSKVRVTVQLIDANNEEHLWSSTYDKELDDLFAIQTDIATRVASSLSGVFARPSHQDTQDVVAYTMYMRANVLINEFLEGSMREAVDLYTKATIRDPGFVRAYAGLSRAWVLIANRGYEDFKVIHQNAIPAAEKALKLGPDVAEAHSAMAAIYWNIDNLAASTVEAKKAIELNPNLASAYQSLGFSQIDTGRLEDVVKAFEKARELDPLAPNGSVNLVEAELALGRREDALAEIERMQQINPGHFRSHLSLAQYYMWNGEFAAAEEPLRKAAALGPEEPIVKVWQGVFYASTGREADARTTLQLFVNEKKESVGLYGQLFMFAALHDLEEAFNTLFRLADVHSWPSFLPYYPVFSELRKDPRYLDFCKIVGIRAKT